jgi:hypothetical protein
MTQKNELMTNGRRRPPPKSDQSVTIGVTITDGSAAVNVSQICQRAMLTSSSVYHNLFFSSF